MKKRKPKKKDRLLTALMAIRWKLVDAICALDEEYDRINERYKR